MHASLQCWQLPAAGLPQLGNSGFALTVPAGPAALQVSDQGFAPAAATPLSVGQGCSVYGDPAALLLALSAGRTLPLAVPGQAALLGQTLLLQAAAVGPGLATSNALELRLGR